MEENNALQETIQALQDQNTSLTSSNHELDKENSILRERLSNFGLRDLFKNLGLLGVGIAIGDIFNKQYERAAIVGVVSALVIIIFSIYDNFFSKRITNRKEKVGV